MPFYLPKTSLFWQTFPLKCIYINSIYIYVALENQFAGKE